VERRTRASLELLEALAAQDLEGAELVVIDSGSRDGTARGRARGGAPYVFRIPQARVQPRRARNRAIAARAARSSAS
jgi:glycosyltransferase involved in cell wall biosynthesis